MAFEIKKETVINSTPEQIWNILINTKAYPVWNPFIKSIDGDLAVGNKIDVDLNGMIFKPIVQSFKKNKEFTWLGHLWIKGIFDGKHKFRLTEITKNQICFEQSETFYGILVPLLKRKLKKEIAENFENMNQALKKLAEKE